MSNKIVKKKENLFIKKTFKPNNKFTKHTSIFYKKSFKYQKLLRKKKSLLMVKNIKKIFHPNQQMSSLLKL